MSKSKNNAMLETDYAKIFIEKLKNHKKEDGNIFDLFSSMEDVGIFLKWMELQYPAEVLEAMKVVLGVSEQEGDYIEVEGIGKIDKSIAPFIQTLNEQGYETLASCSGLLKEHPTKKDRITGYLSFLFDEDKSQIVKSICEELDLPYEEGIQTFFKPSYIVRFKGETDEEMEVKWKMFQQKLEL